MIRTSYHPSRRQMLRSLVGGSLLLPGIVSQLCAAEEGGASTALNPLLPRPSHFAPRAKRVIFLYMSGGTSHVDSFDPKPRLFADHGRPAPTGRGGKRVLKRPNWEARPHGRSGIEITDLFPNIAECADDLCLIRSMKTDHGDHFEATLGIHTGSVTFARPSLGAWVSYGLGSLDQDLQSFIVVAAQVGVAVVDRAGADHLDPVDVVAAPPY